MALYSVSQKGIRIGKKYVNIMDQRMFNNNIVFQYLNMTL